MTKLPQHGFFVFFMMDTDVGYHVHATRGHFQSLQAAQDYISFNFPVEVHELKKPVIVSAQSLMVIEDEWFRH